jgi:hypothetical protein
MLERYGVEHALQDSKISEKASKNSYKIKSFTFSSGETVLCQGYEPFALKMLDDYGYKFEDIIVNRSEVPEIWYEYNCKKHRYFCDIYIPNENRIIEVKSIWTYIKNEDKNIEKKKICEEKGYIFELYIFTPNGKLITIPST